MELELKGKSVPIAGASKGIGAKVVRRGEKMGARAPAIP